ncbi:Separin [Dissostichus eleginoides]|uniref:separase n=1 Tax=Dissostichus eleginoides TaxID=100907 RepID=A0AAD9CFI6_DISEL|nr:Separin [Dissostichus eleginoides]
MKCLKVDEYIERTASVKETDILRQELQKYVKSQTGLQGRTLCDRIIRACNHQLGVGSPTSDHVSVLVQLVELSLHGYDVSEALVAQSSPLYMEKIIFHIVKKLSSLEAHNPCSHVAGLLYGRLSAAQQAEDYFVLVRSCFSVLWNGLSATKDIKILNPRDKLHCQMQALSFLLLLDTDSATPSISKAPIYTEDAITEFESSFETVTKDDASFLLQKMQTLFNRCWTGSQGSDGAGSKQLSVASSIYTLSEMALIIVKMLCKFAHYDLASTFLSEIESKVKDLADCQCTAVVLGKRAVKIHSTMKAGGESGPALTECARALRSLSADLGDREAHAVLEACGLVLWAVESDHSNGLSGPVLLALFSFLEEHQEQIIKVLKKSSTCQAELSRLQQALCINIYQGFGFAYESMVALQLENTETLDRVLLYCQATAGQMMTEIRKLSSESLLVKSVIAQNCPTSLCVDRLSRPFMLAVQTSRRAGHLERALDWVILWLKALGDNITSHMAEPVSLWVRTKTDAARNSEEDIRLRTLHDGFGPDVPDERVMLCLLEEELRAYKEVAGDTSQERYNALCDLLDICHEDSSHTHLRAVYLTEMAQVVCYQDFSEQTDCTAVDFTNEALRLLEEEPETPENADRLKDDKAHALLWLYICTLENNLQEGIEREKKLRELREQSRCSANPIGTNDFDYEDKQTAQDSILVYEGLHFNLAAENKLCKPLERALDEWSALLQSKALPSVRNAKQTCGSLAVTAALFRLMAKPLKALEVYQLAIGLSRELADAPGCATSLCQSASILLDMGSPDLALAQLEQAEKFLTSVPSADGPSSLSMTAVLLKAQYCYSTGQVDRGVAYLCEVLKEMNKQRQSKSWYMLRARTLQTCSSYLSLDSDALPQAQRNLITQHGTRSLDTALYESLKLLCSLLVTLVGKGLYGTNSSCSDTRFIDQGDNLVLKWQLLSELLNCSMKMVAVRSSCGAINDARLQCLEALKLAIKLQALSQCAELLVIKAELELMQGEKDESGMDLDKVRNLLDLCTDFSDHVQKAEVKIKPRKGRPVKKSQSPLPALEDDLESILSTRWNNREPIPCLGRVTARWAATQADLILQLDPNDAKVSFKLQSATLTRCKSVSAKLGAKLAKIFPPHGPSKRSSKPSLMQDVVGRVYLHMALSALEPRHNKVCGIWKVLEAGLAFVDSTTSPVLRPVRAGLMATKAIVSLVTLAEKRGCTPEELFSNAWTWNTSKEDLKSEEKAVPPSSLLKKPKESIKNIPDKTKEAKKVRIVPPRIQGAGSSTKGKRLVPMTPVKAPPTVQKVQRTAPKIQFNVYEELSPEQKKAQPVPAAPRRTNKSFFKLDFSDESDTESNTQAEPKEKTDVPKKRATTRRAAQNSKTATDPPPAEKVPAKRQTRGRKTTALPRSVSSEDDETVVCQTATARRGRPRKELSRPDPDSLEKPDKMRTIEEETTGVQDISMEQLRASDTETEDNLSKDIDFEVLRRDTCCALESDTLSELKSRGHLREAPPTHLSHSDTRPDNLSLEDVESLLLSAWLALQHFPSPSIYTTLCALLALTKGQQDPITTAMLHAQSLGITSRHHTIRHLTSCLRKLKKASNELTDKMDALSLGEPGPNDSKNSTEQSLTQLENIFSFPTADSSSFPKNHCQEFTKQIQHLPTGVTVCVLSVLGVKPGEVGDSIILSRLEKGAAPVTVHISTSKQQHPISWLVQEIDSIQVEQKAVSCVSEKAKWWEGRWALDSRVERLLKEMERLLGCWRSFLLPLSSDPELSKQARHLCKSLSAKGVTVSEEMLKVLLSASSELSQADLRRFGLGVSPQWDTECEQLLLTAVTRLADREEPRGHVVLILDKYLQKLPWESISMLRSRSVSRMPSLHSLIGLSIQKENDSDSILKQGVDTKQVFYVLNPDANLENSQERFQEWFTSKPDWDGVCGVAPDSGQLEEVVATKDLYIYVGHGAGARFLDSQAVLKRQMRAAALLFGCSSAALAVRGDQEGQGIILNYLIAGCPFVLGNLWDVTDRDIDRFTKYLLESWLSAGSGAPLLDYMGPSRQATHLKYLIGAAPVVYGLPLHLQ